MKILIGKGVLSWPKSERVSDRYGTVMLMKDGMDSYATQEGPVSLINTPSGKNVRLFATVIENRQSTHIGDILRGLYPSTPDVGETIDLGIGEIFYEQFRSYTLVGLKPNDDRESDWLNPVALYRAHEQTVELYCEEEEEDHNG